jgi:nucleoside-diphosphate-sugar epimerase
MNEWQAHDYGEKFGMLITGIRPANVTSPDQVRGSVEPAAGMRAAIISSITRLVSEFGVQYRPYRDRVVQIINEVRRDKRLAPLL